MAKRPDNYDYLIEAFGIAVRTLAIGKGDARHRIADAWFSLHTLRAEELPSPLRRRFRAIMRKLTSRPPQHRLDTAPDASARRMQNRTASAMARDICDMHDYLLLHDSQTS